MRKQPRDRSSSTARKPTETAPLLNPSAHLRRIVHNAYDIKTVAGLVEAVGGEAAIANELGVNVDDVHEWIINGQIPPGWHLRLFGHASALGKSVGPKVFGLHTDSAAIGLSMLMERAYSPDEGGDHA